MKLDLRMTTILLGLCVMLHSTSVFAMGRNLPTSPEDPELDSRKPQTYPSRCQELDQFAKNPKWQFDSHTPHSANFILVDKKRRLMHLFSENTLIKSFSIGLGYKHRGTKACSGDNNTPEGQYKISYKNPNSEYHLSLAIDYPRLEDFERADRVGCDPGGDIMIHGLPNSRLKRLFAKTQKDWTKGCVAVSNRAIEDIWDLVDVGTDIEICK